MLVRNGNLELADTLDSDDELAVIADHAGCDALSIWINAEEAQQIVDHLTKVFALKGSTP